MISFKKLLEAVSGSSTPVPSKPKKGKQVVFTKSKKKVKREEPTSLIGSVVSSIAGDIMKTARRHGYEPTEVASAAIRRKESEAERWKQGGGKRDHTDQELFDAHGRRVIFKNKGKKRKPTPSTP